MTGSAISESIILIASIIAAAALSAAVLNQMGVFQSAFSQSTAAQKEITLTKIKTIYASNSTSTVVNVWAKNTGTAPISSLNRVNVFFGKLGSVVMIPYNTGTPSTWTYSNSTMVSWTMKDTVQINISYNTNLQKNTPYAIRITTPNGVSDDYIFSIS